MSNRFQRNNSLYRIAKIFLTRNFLNSSNSNLNNNRYSSNNSNYTNNKQQIRISSKARHPIRIRIKTKTKIKKREFYISKTSSREVRNNSRN